MSADRDSKPYSQWNTSSDHGAVAVLVGNLTVFSESLALRGGEDVAFTRKAGATVLCEPEALNTTQETIHTKYFQVIYLRGLINESKMKMYL